MVDFADADDAVGLDVGMENGVSLSDVHEAFVSLHEDSGDLGLFSWFEHVDVVAHKIDLFRPGDTSGIDVGMRFL